jgi:hypothetical protein
MKRILWSSVVCLLATHINAQQPTAQKDDRVRELEELGVSAYQSVVSVKVSHGVPFRADTIKKLAIYSSYLHTLDLDHVPVADDDLRDIRVLYNLTDLRLRSTDVTDAAFEHIRSLIYLRSLILHDTAVTGSHLNELAECRLRTLELSYTDMDAKAFRHLKLFPTLSRLSLGHTCLGNEHIIHLKPLTRLSDLALNRTQLKGDGGLAAIAGQMPNLSELSLAATRVDDSCITHLGGFPKLTVLGIEHTDVTAAGVRRLAQLRNQGLLQNLIFLLVTPQQIPEDAHKELTAAFPNLHIELITEPPVTGPYTYDRGVKNWKPPPSRRERKP